MKERTYSKDAIFVLMASFFYIASIQMVTPIIAGYAEFLGGTGFLMGMIGGLMTTVSLFCRPVAGNLADRLDKFHIALTGGILIFAACVGYLFVPSLAVVVIARIINGFGYTCCSIGLSTWLSQLLPRNKVGAGIGLYGTVQALAMAISPAVGIKAKNIVGYNGSFTIAALLGLVTVVMVLFVKDRAHPDPKIVPRQFSLRVMDWGLAPIAVGVMLFTIPYSATQSFLVSYLGAVGRAVKPEFFFPLYAGLLVTMRVGLRNQFDRGSFPKFLKISIVSSFAALACLHCMNNYFLMFLAAFFMAGGYGIMCSVAQSTAILFAEEGKSGLANSTYYVGLDIGMALGPIFGGVLYGNLDVRMFYPVLSVCSFLCIGVYIACIKSPRFRSVV